MNQHEINPTGNPPPSGPEHEERDVNVVRILQFGVGILILAVITHIAVWGIYKYFAFVETRPNMSLSPLTPREIQVPDEPRLQVHGVEDLRKVRRVEEERLHSYGWVDQSRGIVRIPIEEAMKMVLQKGQSL